MDAEDSEDDLSAFLARVDSGVVVLCVGGCDSGYAEDVRDSASAGGRGGCGGWVDGDVVGR